MTVMRWLNTDCCMKLCIIYTTIISFYSTVIWLSRHPIYTHISVQKLQWATFKPSSQFLASQLQEFELNQIWGITTLLNFKLVCVISHGVILAWKYDLLHLVKSRKIGTPASPNGLYGKVPNVLQLQLTMCLTVLLQMCDKHSAT